MQIAVQTLLHVGLRMNNTATIDPTLGQLLGRPARAIEQYIQDCHALWVRDREPDSTVHGTQAS